MEIEMQLYSANIGNTLLIHAVQRCIKVWLQFIVKLVHKKKGLKFFTSIHLTYSSSVTVLVILNTKCHDSVSTMHLLLLGCQLIGIQFHTCHLICHLFCIKSFPHPCYHIMQHSCVVNCSAASVASPMGDIRSY